MNFFKFDVCQNLIVEILLRQHKNKMNFFKFDICQNLIVEILLRQHL